MHKFKILLILCSIGIVNILEIIGIGIIPVYLYYILNIDIIYSEFPEITNFLLNFTSMERLPFYVIIFIILFFLFKNILMLLIQVFQVFFWMNFRLILSKDIFSYYLNLSLVKFLKINPSMMMNNIITESAHSASVVRDGIILINEIVFFIFLFLLISFTQPIFIVICISALLSITVVFYVSIKNIIKSKGDLGLSYRNKYIKFLNQGFGLFKETMIYQKKKYVIENFMDNVKADLKTSAFSKIISSIPRLFIEVISVSIILGTSYLFLKNNPDNIESFIPTITLFAISFIRVIPSINKIVVQLTRIKFFATSSNNLNNIINKQLEYKDLFKKNNVTEINFNSLDIKNVSFNYSQSGKKILTDINVSINKGDKVAIIGETGSGKSTLLNLMLGLLEYNEGKILLNNKIDLKSNLKNWYSNLSFVPQEVYLFDGSIKENIILKDDLDQEGYNNLIEVTKDSQIDSFISNLEKSFETNVGDRGVEISGGQKQRIGIARALFHNNGVLCFDEATSALDTKTEDLIVSKITSDENTTFISVTHRVNTLKYFNKVITVKDGRILSIIVNK